MFKISEKTDLNQISLTGMRALVLIGLLIVKPRSLDEIRKSFIDFRIMEDFHSDDILRIDLNTVKLMGCEISRSSAKTNFKYILTKHPFALNIPEIEFLALNKAYALARKKADLNTLLEYHELFNKIALHICDNESKEAMLGVSILKYYDYQMVIDLIEDCKEHNIVELIYAKSSNTKGTCKKVIAQNVVYKNDKLYLYGYDITNNKAVVLNLRRIKHLLRRHKNNHDVELNQTKIKFILKNVKQNDLEINEEIIDKTEGGYLIEGSYHNEFLAFQRILSFGSRCIVVEPLDFKNNVIAKIKEMRQNYGC